jgi:hypothetical protein
VILTRGVAQLTALDAIDGVKERLRAAVANCRWDDHLIQVRGSGTGGRTLADVLSRKEVWWTAEIQAAMREYDPSIGRVRPVEVVGPSGGPQPHSAQPARADTLSCCSCCLEHREDYTQCPGCDKWFCEKCLGFDDHGCPNKP